MTTMDHVRYLAETIGPRGSTTAAEAKAANYAAQVLDGEGLVPTSESFSSAKSAWHPVVLFCGAVLVAEVLFLLEGLWGAVAAVLLAGYVLSSVLLELAFRSNPLRWLLPKARSQNVWARIQPTAELKEQVVIMGHLDTHRTPLVFSTDRWLGLYQSFVPVGLVSAVGLVVVFAVGIASPDVVWRWLSLPLALVMLALFGLTAQADLSPYTAGADDNASGAAVVLSTAAQLAHAPLAHTAVWAVLSGCEEVGCYGADAFARAHVAELGRAAWVVVDSAGGRGARPSYLASETFLLTVRSDAGLAAAFQRVAHRRPDLEAHASAMRGAYTEGAIGAQHGFRVLSLISQRTDGGLPEWHRPTDVADSVDPEVVGRTETLLWELLQEIDVEAARRP